MEAEVRNSFCEHPDRKYWVHIIELQTQIIRTLGSENINPTNLPDKNQNDDIKIHISSAHLILVF